MLVAVKTKPAAAPGPVLTATARAGVGINLLQSFRSLVAGGRLGQDYEGARRAPYHLFLDLDPAHRMIVAWIEDYDTQRSSLGCDIGECTEHLAATAGRVNCQSNAADLTPPEVSSVTCQLQLEG